LYHDSPPAVKSKAMGADEYIVKPFHLEDLMKAVKRLLGVAEEAKVGSTGGSAGKLAAG